MNKIPLNQQISRRLLMKERVQLIMISLWLKNWRKHIDCKMGEKWVFYVISRWNQVHSHIPSRKESFWSYVDPVGVGKQGNDCLHVMIVVYWTLLVQSILPHLEKYTCLEIESITPSTKIILQIFASLMYFILYQKSIVDWICFPDVQSNIDTHFSGKCSSSHATAVQAIKKGAGRESDQAALWCVSPRPNESSSFRTKRWRAATSDNRKSASKWTWNLIVRRAHRRLRQ